MRVEYRTWDGDFKALHDLAARSWREEYRAGSYPDLYDPALLRMHLRSVEPRGLLIGAYRGTELLGFVANLPRLYLVGGRPYRGVLACLLTTHPDFRREGFAKGLIEEALRRNKEYAFDFALLYLERGHRSSHLFRGLAAEGHAIGRVKRMFAIGRILDLPRVVASEGFGPGRERLFRALRLDRIGATGRVPGVLRRYQDSDLPAAVDLVNAQAGRAEIGRVWTAEELGSRLAVKDLAHTVVYERAEGRLAGLINYTIVRHMGCAPTPWAWLDRVVADDLTMTERGALLKKFLHHAQEQGCAGVVEWNKGYYRVRSLWGERFFPYPRWIELCAWTFNPDLRLEHLKRIAEEQR
ncbi:MAG: GNAT family N-acetyltransferase [Myxococcales bacterium]|nr:GNAT family N-acetyltransferase [Myxococcales bacterium]